MTYEETEHSLEYPVADSSRLPKFTDAIAAGDYLVRAYYRNDKNVGYGWKLQRFSRTFTDSPSENDWETMTYTVGNTPSPTLYFGASGLVDDGYGTAYWFYLESDYIKYVSCDVNNTNTWSAITSIYFKPGVMALAPISNTKQYVVVATVQGNKSLCVIEKISGVWTLAASDV